MATAEGKELLNGNSRGERVVKFEVLRRVYVCMSLNNVGLTK